MSDEIQIQILRELEKITEILHMQFQVYCKMTDVELKPEKQHENDMCREIQQEAKQKFDMHEGDF